MLVVQRRSLSNQPNSYTIMLCFVHPKAGLVDLVLLKALLVR